MLRHGLEAALVGLVAWAAWRAGPGRRRRRGAQAAPAAAEEAGVHIVGSSVNLPDMSANLKAKVLVSDAVQADPAALAAVYDAMARALLLQNLNLPAVDAMRQYFSNLEGPGEAVPLDYGAFPVPLPPGAVRLCVVFFQEANPELAELVHQAAAEVLAALPEGTKTHRNKPSHYHITVYMTSQPHTLRSDPFDPDTGGIAVDGTPAEQAASAAPAPETLEREVAVMREAAAATPAPAFEVSRLLLADSGTLLLCSVDHSGHLARLRGRLRASFPGGPPKQSTIVHASIARVLTPARLSPQVRAEVRAVCDRWTARLAGTRFAPAALHHIQESTFTTVEGPRLALPFAA